MFIISIVIFSQVVFLAMSYATVYLIYMRFRNSYDSENDSFRVEFLLVPVIGLSFLEHYAFTPLEVNKQDGIQNDSRFKISAAKNTTT